MLEGGETVSAGVANELIAISSAIVNGKLEVTFNKPPTDDGTYPNGTGSAVAINCTNNQTDIGIHSPVVSGNKLIYSYTGTVNPGDVVIFSTQAVPIGCP